MSHPPKGGEVPGEPAPDWKLPTSDNDVEGMIRIQQWAFRETNAFPTKTPLTEEERAAIVAELPIIGTPNAVPGRLKVFARGHMLSLDLDRIDNGGSWSAGTELDNEIQDYLRELCGNDGLQHEMGVVALGGVIGKDEKDASPTAHATSLSPELDTSGIFLVTRQRLVARFALRSTGQTFVVRKRSDFDLHALEAPTDEMMLRASAIAHGGFRMDFGSYNGIDIEQLEGMNTRLRAGFNNAVEEAIRTRAPYMRPFSMGYHVAMKHSGRDAD